MISIRINWIYMGSLVFIMGVALMQGYLTLMKRMDGALKKKISILFMSFWQVFLERLYMHRFSAFFTE